LHDQGLVAGTAAGGAVSVGPGGGIDFESGTTAVCEHMQPNSAKLTRDNASALRKKPRMPKRAMSNAMRRGLLVMGGDTVRSSLIVEIY
jgi:hypothetical protein